MLGSPWQKSRGRRYAPGTDGVTPWRSRNASPRSSRSQADVAHNPLGDGHLRSSALSFVGGDHPDRHPPHSAPSNRRSPPRLPRDFYHGLLVLILDNHGACILIDTERVDPPAMLRTRQIFATKELDAEHRLKVAFDHALKRLFQRRGAPGISAANPVSRLNSLMSVIGLNFVRRRRSHPPTCVPCHLGASA